MTERAELETWANSAEIVTSEEGSELVMTTARRLSIPIAEIPVETLGRLERRRLPSSHGWLRSCSDR